MDQTLVSLNFLTEQCQHVMQTIDLLCLPEVKPIICEYTDAGPGVGISNTAVRFRFAEMCRIQNSVRRARIHRASGDSAQNEAERTNSSIGSTYYILKRTITSQHLYMTWHHIIFYMLYHS